MSTLLEPAPQSAPPHHDTLRDVVREVCQRIAPLWPLRQFVAVNPFVGLADRPFPRAARLMQQVGHGEMLMPARFYLDRIGAGEIQEHDVAAALEAMGETLPPARPPGGGDGVREQLRQALEATAGEADNTLLTFAEHADRRLGREGSGFIVEEISKWCSAYFDQGQSSWRMPWRGLGLFEAWRAAGRLDANPELMGMGGFRRFVAGLSADPLEVVGRALEALEIPACLRAEFLHRQLMTVRGWSGHIQYGVRARSMQGSEDDTLVQLLAIRLAYDLALRQALEDERELLADWRWELGRARAGGGAPCPRLRARLIAQHALEHAYQRRLAREITARPPAPARPVERPALQAVFCIDVRSEVFRRALESQSDAIETIGFAGFFGAAIEYQPLGGTDSSARCPVLLLPRHRVRETLRPPGDEAAFLGRAEFRKALNGAWSSFKTSAVSCFSFVETSGLWFGVNLARASLCLATPEAMPAGRGTGSGRGPQVDPEPGGPRGDRQAPAAGIALADQVDLAAGALKHMGLVKGFARVVLLCGHGSTTANNPYGSALDCGACGGHAGDANARVMAAILNKEAVRDGLRGRGIPVPRDTVFLAGLHDTTTDEVTLYEEGHVDAAQEELLQGIKGWLSGAGRQARQERAAALGLGHLGGTELDRAIRVRSRDWSQVRPEWGLAGNAAFIAAPRARTQGLKLGGRVFLHNYHADRDADHSTLELILTAPMVVASWINLQYYGSTVDNRLFGSGNKALHNVVGTFGVWQGNGGDLQPGLPLQSLHDGTRLVHEPLRLSVFIEAGREHMDAVLRAHAHVRQLVENGWVHLFSIDPADGTVWRCQGPSLWHPFAA